MHGSVGNGVGCDVGSGEGSGVVHGVGSGAGSGVGREVAGAGTVFFALASAGKKRISIDMSIKTNILSIN